MPFCRAVGIRALRPGLLLGAALLLLSGSLQADATLTATVRAATDATLGGMVRDGRTSFAASFLISDGQVAFATAYGHESPEMSLPFSNESTLFDLNSYAKLFTAAAIAQLLDRGVIKSLDDPINLYLKHYHLPRSSGREITIRAIATHSAGFDLAGFGAGPLESDPAKFFERRFPGYFDNAGTFSAYDSYGPRLLAYMVSEISGRPFPRYVEESILRPLGMTHTFLTERGSPPAHRVIAFQPGNPKNIAERPPLRSETAAMLGGVYVSTMNDMARFVAALLGPAPDQNAITQPMRNSLFRIWQSNGDGGSAHGLLFDAIRVGSQTLFVHGGIGPGIDCMMALDVAAHAGNFYCYGDVRGRFDNKPKASPLPYAEVIDAMLEPFTACSAEHPVNCRHFPPSGWKDAWNQYLGDYIDFSRHHHGFSYLRTLLHPTTVHVEKAADSLQLDGRAGFVEIAPGVFGSPRYIETFAFIKNPATGRTVLTISDRPSAYERPGILSDAKVLPRLLAALVIVALSGVLIVFFPTYGIDRRVRLAVALYGVVVGAAVAILFGLRAFGARYFDGISWPLDIVRVLAFATLPACAWLILCTYGANRIPLTGAARGGRIHLDAICLSSILMVAALILVHLISFGPIL